MRTSLKLAVPAMVAQFVNVLYSIVDRIFVGNMAEIGDLALAGVGVCAPVTTLITSFASLVGIGGAPIFAMSMGEGRNDNARKILSNALLMLIIIAACLTAVILPLLKPLLMTFGASENTYPFAREYMLVYASGCVFAVLSAGLNQFITAQGYSGVAMATVCIGAVANVGLDPLFIFTLDMGVTGAAAATVLSQGISAVFVTVFLLLPKTKVRLSLGGYSGKTILRIVKMGLSPFFITATDSVIIIVLNAVVQKYGGADGDMWVTVATIVQAFLTLITMPMLRPYQKGGKDNSADVFELYHGYVRALLGDRKAVRVPVHKRSRDSAKQHRRHTQIYDRHNPPCPAILLCGRSYRLGTAKIRIHSLHNAQAGAAAFAHLRAARDIRSERGILRRARGGHSKRMPFHGDVRPCHKQDIEKTRAKRG